MTSSLDRSDRAAGDRARARAYALDFWPGIAAYLVLLAAAIVWGHLDGRDPVRYLWALLPVLPAFWIVRAAVRHLRRADEFERHVQLQGIAAGFALAMLASLTLGFLGIAGLAMTGAGWVVYLIGMLGWLVGTSIARRR